MTAAANRKVINMDAVKKYHETATTYRKSLREAWDAYGKGYERLQGYKGSERYDRELKELQDERDAAIEAAREKARGSFGTTIGYMRKAIEAQPATAPTAEQMAMLNALQMRDHVEADEIVRAARQMSGVDMAVRVLDEIAEKNGKHGLVDEYMGAAGRATRAVDRLAGNANSMLKLTRPDGLQKRHEAHHAAKWGGAWDERHEGIELRGDSNGYSLSHVDRDFKDERETAIELGGVGGHYSEFRSMVNYDPTIKPGLQKTWGEV